MKAVRVCLVILILLFTSSHIIHAHEIHTAVENGDLEAVKGMIEQDRSLLETRTDAGSTPLHIACERGNLEMALYLLDAGADPMAGDNENSTPIHVAAIGGNTRIVELLLEKGIDIDTKDDHGMTPILFAGYRRQNEMIEFLLSKGADIGAKSNEGGSMVHAAAYTGNIELLQHLIDGGADVDLGPDRYRNTPLAAACFRCQTEAARLLLENGAALNPAFENAQSPLDLVILRNCEETLGLLLDKGADPNYRTESGWTPLIWAANHGNAAIVTALLDRGGDPSLANDLGWTPLIVAVSEGHTEASRVLAGRGHIDKSENSYGWTPLHIAAVRGYTDITDDLLARGAEANAKDLEGKTPLYYASKHGNRSCAEGLEKQGGKSGKYERNFGRSRYVEEKMSDGEAYVWHLGHSGWAVRTRNNLLVFDYWEGGRKPDEPGLANGYITPEELKGLNVTVFVSHEHSDHHSPSMLEWRDTVPGIRYIFGFEQGDVQDYIFAGPRKTVKAGDMKISTIESNDSGVGFLVEVDGLRILHAGDHANRQQDFSGPYCGEIDYLAKNTGEIDLAFLPVTGCGFGDQVAVEMGVYYALDKLDPIIFVPMHGGSNTIRYREYADEVRERGLETSVAAVKSRGDRFHYHKERGLEF